MGRHKKEQDTNLSIYLDYPCKKPNEDQINPYCKESIESIKITEEDVYEIIKNNANETAGTHNTFVLEPTSKKHRKIPKTNVSIEKILSRECGVICVIEFVCFIEPYIS